MTKKYEVYRCEICGNIIEVIHEGSNTLMCCGQLMKQVVLEANQERQEKHLPVVEKKDRKLTVKIGAVLHPMLAEHYIEWIEVINGDESVRSFLNPGDEPIAEFEMESGGEIIVRTYCNLHGLWQSIVKKI